MIKPSINHEIQQVYTQLNPLQHFQIQTSFMHSKTTLLKLKPKNVENQFNFYFYNTFVMIQGPKCNDLRAKCTKNTKEPNETKT